jgi:hypothetical protein
VSKLKFVLKHLQNVGNRIGRQYLQWGSQQSQQHSTHKVAKQVSLCERTKKFLTFCSSDATMQKHSLNLKTTINERYQLVSKKTKKELAQADETA